MVWGSVVRFWVWGVQAAAFQPGPYQVETLSPKGLKQLHSNPKPLQNTNKQQEAEVLKP